MQTSHPDLLLENTSAVMSFLYKVMISPVTAVLRKLGFKGVIFLRGT